VQTSSFNLAEHSKLSSPDIIIDEAMGKFNISHLTSYLFKFM